jgi:hypothetical protein
VASPTPSVRKATVLRDNSQCALCGALSPLEWNHRAAVGMGGSKKQPGVTEGVMLCSHCNTAIESDALRMKVALIYGIKVRRWADPTKVPVFYPRENRWYRFDGTERVEVPSIVALDLMHAVYGDEYLLWTREVML